MLPLLNVAFIQLDNGPSLRIQRVFETLREGSEEGIVIDEDAGVVGGVVAVYAFGFENMPVFSPEKADELCCVLVVEVHWMRSHLQ